MDGDKFGAHAKHVIVRFHGMKGNCDSRSGS